MYESCDGAKLSIGNVYYIEFMFYTDNSKDVYVNPLDLELLIAKKHGILSKIKVIFLWIINTYLKKKIEGFDTKIRFWIKPNTMVDTYKRLICPLVPDNGQ